MGYAFVEMHVSLRDRLITEPALADLVLVLNHEAEAGEDGIILARVRSPLLPAGDNGMQEIIVEGNHVRFKKWEDV